MKNVILSAAAAAALALCASSAFAHGHIVTGPELYATPEASQPANPAPQATTAHKARIVHRRHVPAADSAS